MPQILVDTPEFRIASEGPVYIVAWKKPVDSALWELAEPHFRAKIQSTPSLMGLVVVALAGFEVNDVPRSRVSEFMKDAQMRLLASAFVFPSTGVWSAIARATTNAVLSFSGKMAGPVRFFSQADEAAGWLEQHLRLAELLARDSDLRTSVRQCLPSQGEGQ